MKRHFISFAGGGPRYQDAGERIKSQALGSHFFDTVKLVTCKDLKQNAEFWKVHGPFVLENKRGYGYWLWKPYIILQLLRDSKVAMGDVVVYLDSGCEVNRLGKEGLLNEWIRKAKYAGGIGGRAASSNDARYTKRSLSALFSISCDDPVLKEPHVEAGMLIIEKNGNTLDLVRKWYDTCCTYSLLDDSPSSVQDTGLFIEHRHDQSVLNILLKTSEPKLHATCIPAYVDALCPWSPLWYARNRGGNSKIILVMVVWISMVLFLAFAFKWMLD